MQNKSKKDLLTMRNDAEKIFRAGLMAVDPVTAIRNNCLKKKNTLIIGGKTFDLSQFDNIYIIGAGKAASPMAAAMESLLGKMITDGTINVKYDHIAHLNIIKTIEAGHPIPDKNGWQGAKAIMSLLKKTQKNDLVLCLISGGGSALLPIPAKGLTLKDKQATIQLLLACGATINEINAIRKHISMVKGGRLAKAVHPSTLVTLILSDVVGDDLDVIASGPTVPDPSTYMTCMDIIKKYDLADQLPKPVLRHIQDGISEKIPETPKIDDPIFKKTYNYIIGSSIEAILAAKERAESIGYNTLILSSMIEGETRHVAKVHTAIAKEIKKSGYPLIQPACIISGGETTVTLVGNGKGGRNQEFSLAAAMDIAGHENIVVFSAGTDGTDGPTDAAGAVVDTNTMKNALELNIDPVSYLTNNDSYEFFKKIDSLFITGPTNTNVMDLRIMLIT